MTSVEEDRQHKEHISHAPSSNRSQRKQSYDDTIGAERERRWKAEQAAVRLAEHVRNLQLQGTYLGVDHQVFDVLVVRQ